MFLANKNDPISSLTPIYLSPNVQQFVENSRTKKNPIRNIFFFFFERKIRFVKESFD